jgi:hypothetical protein
VLVDSSMNFLVLVAIIVGDKMCHMFAETFEVSISVSSRNDTHKKSLDGKKGSKIHRTIY